MAKSPEPKSPPKKSVLADGATEEVPIKPQVIKVGPKGVITIPDENRRAMDLEPGKYITAIQVGRSLVLSPEINEFLAIAEQFQRELVATGGSVDTLSEGLAASRRELTEELYGASVARKARPGA